MTTSIIILLFFCLGLFSGVLSIFPLALPTDEITPCVLYALLFFVGITVGANRNALSILKKYKIKILLVPITTVIGTFLGVSIVSIFLSDMSLKETMAVGAGFGYYSLSSVIISELGSKVLGVIALISNITREIITLIATPIFAKIFGKIAPIASGGATAMDTTLPIITRFSGKRYALVAVFSGLVLTILVPLLVSFILSL